MNYRAQLCKEITQSNIIHYITNSLSMSAPEVTLQNPLMLVYVNTF